MDTIEVGEVVEWIGFYEEGHEIPDEVMVKILNMAHLYAISQEEK
jgi:hypothetical protein